ncbi:glycoside hydrolase [Wenjunlia tyrosinilytica]|uniref:Glycoside hydrolase n=2 Tax=Wenjunlia tyrosinilytica TaxID=1544741 RepID=A0A918DTM2_9ACTN|nr:glycoside hydrolase [Wenjunlia tyrosinilytica]
MARVDSLYRQAGSATQRYDAAKERTAAQRRTVARLLAQVDRDTEALAEARRRLGQYASEQYRTGGLSDTGTLLLTLSPQSYFDQSHLLGRLTRNQQHAVVDFRAKQKRSAEQRRRASKGLAELTDAQHDLEKERKAVRHKLEQARDLLADLTEKERERLAALRAGRDREAGRQADELARRERERGDGDDGLPWGGYTSVAARKAVAFARAQLDKPYVWGATGPRAYDCSGLTQGAWRAAGVRLPRTTWEQIKAGRRIAVQDLRPGDLVFFFDDISHVGLYIGAGRMIHAPKPGDFVKVAPITQMPIYGAVRPE